LPAPAKAEPPRCGKACCLSTEALERLVQLYDGCDKKEKSDEWRKKLEKTNAAAKPPPNP
jgi:hypothetical protein